MLDTDSLEPLPFYTNLAIPPPVQLPLTLSGAQLTLTNAALAPPSIPSLVPGLGCAGAAAATGAGSAAAAAAAADVAAVRLEGGVEQDAAAAAAGGAAGLVAMLTSAAKAGGLAAVNLLGNSRVDVTGVAATQQQQEQQQDGQSEQQQQQRRQVSVHIEPRPVGGHQGRPCCMLHVVLLLEDKAAYQQG